MTKRFTIDTDRVAVINAAIAMPIRLFGPDGREYKIIEWKPSVEQGKAIVITASLLVESRPVDASEASPVDTSHGVS